MCFSLRESFLFLLFNVTIGCILSSLQLIFVLFRNGRSCFETACINFPISVACPCLFSLWPFREPFSFSTSRSHLKNAKLKGREGKDNHTNIPALNVTFIGGKTHSRTIDSHKRYATKSCEETKITKMRKLVQNKIT